VRKRSGGRGGACGQEPGGSGPGKVRGGFAGPSQPHGRRLDEASDRLLAVACLLMFPPALIVRDWPVFRIVGQSLDFQVFLFGFTVRVTAGLFVPPCEFDFE